MVSGELEAQPTRLKPNCSTHPLAFLFILLVAVWSVHASQTAALATDLEEEPTVRVYEQVAPTIVLITSAYLPRHQLTDDLGGSIGSGMIVDKQGVILTNAHVVDGAAKITVMLQDGTRLAADVVGIDQISDIALLHVQLPSEGHYAVATLGDSDRIRIGQKVLAIGHPFGLGYALTTGVVSGFGTTPDRARRVIQTSAAVNPGNSGGPLVDLGGRVIGVTNALLLGAQNIGFAIPINRAREIMAELRTHGRVVRPWLGISGTWLPEEVMDLFTLPLSKGFLVEDVQEGSPADKAGLRAGALKVTLDGGMVVLGGDIIKTVDGFDVTTPERFADVLQGLKVGQTIELDILRDGVPRKMSTIVQEFPQVQIQKGKAKVQEKIGLQPGGLQYEPSTQWNRHLRF